MANGKCPNPQSVERVSMKDGIENMNENSKQSVWENRPKRKEDRKHDSTKIITPESAEKQMVYLGVQVDNAHSDLEQAEYEFQEAKAAYEIRIAEIRLGYADSERKMTAQEREDNAVIGAKEELHRLRFAEAMVRSARANSDRLSTQVDIARSVGTSVRASLEQTKG